MKIGVIGLGIIGSRVAARWREAGHDVMGWNRTPARAQPADLPLAPTPRELAERSEVVFIVVADPPALREVVSGPDGIARAALRGRIVLNASTVGAADNREAERAVRAAGADFLETPFTGSKDAAAAGKLVFYVGGDPAVLRRVEPVLLEVGLRTLHFGPVGAAADAKLVMNFMLAHLMQAMAEGLAFAGKAGLDLETFIEAYRANAGWSVLAGMKLPRMIEGDYTPHFSLKHMDKDLRLALERAGELGVHAPLTGRLKEIFSAAMAEGMGDDDFATVYRMVARASGLER